MSDFVTYLEADVTPAEVVTLVVRTKARVAAQSSAFCGDLSSNTWFPVAPGTTLPSPPAATTNASPAPANSVPLPSGLDPNDTCYIFQDLLPVTSAPVYAEELEPVAVLPPYIEELPLLGITVAGMSIVEWPYALTLPAGSIEAVTRSVINIPTYNETLEAGAYALNGQDAAVVRRYTLVGAAGSYALAGQAVDFVRGYVVAGAAGTYAINGQDAGLVYQRLPMALDAGLYALIGQDASLFKGITMVADVGSYTLSGQDADRVRNYVLAGDAGTYALTGQDANLVAADTYFSSVGVLLRMNGANNSTTFTDSSSNGFAFTVFGNTKISTAQSKFGEASGAFDGNGDYLQLSYNSAFDLLGSAFTIETWVYPLNLTADRRIISLGGGLVGYNSTNGIHVNLQITSTGLLNMGIYTTTGAIGISSTATISANTWTHIAACVNGTTGYLAVNGTVSSASIGTVSRPSTNPQLAIGTIPGEAGNVAFAFNGYMDEVRITKGYARYLANFTPSNSPFPAA